MNLFTNSFFKSHIFNLIRKIFLKPRSFLGIYPTFSFRPVKTSRISCLSQDLKQLEKISIVLQGPLQTKNNFTLETVKLYKKYYPLSPIIISTWDNSDIQLIKKIQEAGAIVCLSKLPENKGRGNINCQRISSLAGIEKARAIGCSHILKTRTDQRLYANNVLTYLLNILNLFPLKLNTKAHSRIISTSNCTFSDRLYNISDLCLFGTIDDMQRYFSCPEDTLNIPKNVIYNNPVDFAQSRPGEIYFSTHYFENLGFKLDWTFEQSKYFLKELFVIIDCESLDMFWPKYVNIEYRWRNYGQRNDLQQITFRDWLEYYFSY